MKVVSALRAARLQQKITQGALGKRLNMTQAHLSDIEQGKVNPRLDTVIEIARSLGQDIIVVPRNRVTMIEDILAGTPFRPLWDPGEPEEEEED